MTINASDLIRPAACLAGGVVAGLLSGDLGWGVAAALASLTEAASREAAARTGRSAEPVPATPAGVAALGA